MVSASLLFAAILVLNVMPAFAPPTRMILSSFGLHYPDTSPWVAAAVAAVAASGGRAVLAFRSARRGKPACLAHDAGQPVRDRPGHRAPAYRQRLRLLALRLQPLAVQRALPGLWLTCARRCCAWWALFVGRLVSYAIAFAGASAQHLELELSSSDSLLYLVATQVALLASV